MAQELGATEVINASEANAQEVLLASGGVNFTLEATGVPAVLEQAIKVLTTRGICGVVGGPPPDATLTLNILSDMFGKSIVGVVEGDSNPNELIPQLVEYYLAGNFPIDRLIKRYPFGDFAQAFADARSGATIKPVLVMG